MKLTIQERYGVSNSKYRLMKELVVIELDVQLLQDTLDKLTDELKLPEVKNPSELYNELSDKIYEVRVSLGKKIAKREELVKEKVD